MNPLGWLRNLVRRGEDPARYRRWIPVNIDGLKLTPDQMMSTAAVWACVNAISNAISGCQWQLYTPLGPHKRQLLYGDSLNWLLNTRPNPDSTAMALRESLLIQAVAWGNAYAEIVPDRLGRPAALYPLLSDRVMPRRDLATWKLVYDVIEADGSITSVAPERIFHVHGPGVSGVLGENIIARAARSIAVSVAQEKYAAGFFGRGASPNGILQVEKGKMSEPVKEALKKDFAERVAGLANTHKPLVLEDGTKFTPLGIEPQKAQLVEEQQFSVEQIARWFGVPLHKIGHLLRATFSNIEQQDLQFVRDTLTPWARRLEQEADYKLVGPRAPRFTCIDLRPLTQGDAASRAAFYSSGLQNGWLTINETRAFEGLDNIGPDGDVPLINGASKPLEAVLRPPPPPPPPAPALPPGTQTVEQDQSDPNEGNADDVARMGLSVIVAGAVERHAKRVANARAKERASKTPAEVAEILAGETERSIARLKLDLMPAAQLADRVGVDLAALDIDRAVRFFEQGQPVLKALPS